MCIVDDWARVGGAFSFCCWRKCAAHLMKQPCVVPSSAPSSGRSKQLHSGLLNSLSIACGIWQCMYSRVRGEGRCCSGNEESGQRGGQAPGGQHAQGVPAAGWPKHEHRRRSWACLTMKCGGGWDALFEGSGFRTIRCDRDCLGSVQMIKLSRKTLNRGWRDRVSVCSPSEMRQMTRNAAICSLVSHWRRCATVGGMLGRSSLTDHAQS